MYAHKFIDGEIVSSNNIKLRTSRLAEFHRRLKNGEDIFCIDSNAMVSALSRSQGVVRGQLDTEGNRYLTKITLVEYENSKIPHEAIICLLDILTSLLFFRFGVLHKDFKFSKRTVSIKKEKLSHITYTQDDCGMISQLITQGFELLENERFTLSLRRFYNAYLRTDFRDLILDCSSSIEALFNFSKELTLRYTLAAYHIDIFEPAYTSMVVKKMYKVRSAIIHGKDSDEINNHQFIGDLLTTTHHLLLSSLFRNQIFSDSEMVAEILNHYKGIE